MIVIVQVITDAQRRAISNDGITSDPTLQLVVIIIQLETYRSFVVIILHKMNGVVCSHAQTDN